MDLVPRSYQLEAVKAGLESNRVINLPTGSGKTLVAAILHEKIVEEVLDYRTYC